MKLIASVLLLPFLTHAEPVTVHPNEDPQARLHNPGMGWVVYENYPIDPDPHGSSTMLTLPTETFSAVDEVALMFTWADIEKSPDHYDFAAVDRAYDYWHTRGKAIQLRMSAETLLWWNARTPPAGLGVPTYVVDKLPANDKKTRTSDGIRYTVVDAREPYYLDRLAKFLSAVEMHFGQAHPVTLIDLRGFGLWGEWHTGYPYATADDRHAALSGVLDCWSKNLPTHTLALSYSYDPDSPASYHAGSTRVFEAKFTDTYAEFTRYSAFDHALTLPNITLRRDGVGGAVHSNERRYNETVFNVGRGPMMSEFLGGYAACKKGGRAWVDWMIDDALSVHPNYIALLGWQGSDALDFTRERPDLVDKGLREMGYRLVPTKLAYPATIRVGEAFSIEGEWINRGVGRMPHNATMTLSLLDAAGKVIATADAGTVKSHDWVKGQTYATKNEATFKDASAGECTLCLSLFDAECDKRIALPLKGRDDLAYPLGTIQVHH